MKIVITGHPKSAKTTLVHVLEKEFGSRLSIAPDAIDILKASEFPKPKSEYGRKCYQKALYHLQQEIENIVTDCHTEKYVLCDHGSLDCLSRWPGSEELFFQQVGSSLGRELSRYAWVIQIADGDAKLVENQFINPQDFWQYHPRIFSLDAQADFSSLANQASQIVKGILQGLPYDEIVSLVFPEKSLTFFEGHAHTDIYP